MSVIILLRRRSVVIQPWTEQAVTLAKERDCGLTRVAQF